MRPDFRGFLAWVLSAHDARGWRQVALQTKSEKYCSQASRASMHCNQGRLRTCFRVFTRPRPIAVLDYESLTRRNIIRATPCDDSRELISCSRLLSSIDEVNE